MAYMSRNEWLRLQVSQSDRTTKELIGALGMKKTSFDDYMNGTRRISRQVMERLESVFGKKADSTEYAERAKNDIADQLVNASNVDRISDKKLLAKKCIGCDCRKCINITEDNCKCQFGLEIIRRGLI